MNDSPALARRAFLTLGTAALLSGCGSAPGGRTATEPSVGAWRGGASPSAPQPGASEPGPGLCPTNADVERKPGNPQQYLPCRDHEIALTIDDGPHPVWTPKVLALLARYDIRATFCMIGQNVAGHPDLAARVIDGGHQIANHTFTHPLALAGQSPARIRAEIERTTDAIVSAGGSRPRLFRAPGGTWSQPVMAACAAAGLRPLDWSVDTRDWSLPGVPHIVDTILARTHPGAIILDHDGGGNRKQTVEALGIALPRLLDEGYKFTQP